MSILNENFEESKEVIKIEDYKRIEKVAFSDLRRFLDWLRLPVSEAA